MRCKDGYCGYRKFDRHTESWVCDGDKLLRQRCPRALRRENERLKGLIVDYDENARQVSHLDRLQAPIDALHAEAARIKAGKEGD